MTIKCLTASLPWMPMPAVPPPDAPAQPGDKAAHYAIEPGQNVEISIAQEGEGKIVVTETKPLT